MTNRPEMLLWLSDARGQYIPRDFASSFADRAKSVANVSDENWSILEAGPDHEWYWEAWTEVCDNAIVTDEDGAKHCVHQDGDCWLVPEGMAWDEYSDTYQWPEDMPTVFDYHINLDERGEFSADVRKDEETVLELRGFDIFEDGFMEHKDDMDGLLKYLVQMDIAKKGDTIHNNH